MRIEDLHLRRDELHHVLVAGDDEDLVLLLGGFASEGADDVVGLKAFGLEDGNAQRFKRAANVGNLAAKILGHGFALGLVALVAHVFEALRLRVPRRSVADGAGALVAKDFAADVEDRGEVLGREVLAQLLDHVDEDVGGRGGQAGARGHGPRALHGVIGAEDEGHRVEQEDGRLGRSGIDSENSSGVCLLHSPARNADPSTPFVRRGGLRSLRMTTLLNEHAVAVAEEAVAGLDGVTVGGEDAVETGALGPAKAQTSMSRLDWGRWKLVRSAPTRRKSKPGEMKISVEPEWA